MSLTEKSVNSGQIKKIWKYLTPYRKLLSLSLGLIVIISIITPIRPLLIQRAVDNYITNKDLKGLSFISAIIFLILILETILQFSDSYIANLLGQNVIRDLRKDLFKKITGFKTTYFDETPIGTLVTRTISDIQSIADIFSQGILMIFGDLLKLTFVLCIMFSTDWELTLVSLTTIPLLLFATWIFKNAVKAAFQDVRNQVARLNAFVQEHITGMSIIQNFNMQEKEMKKFREINARHRDANVRSVWHYSIFLPLVELLSAISIGLIIWYGSREILHNDVTAGILVAFILYINMLFRPIRQLADRFNTLQMGMVASERIFRIMETKAEIDNTGTLKATGLKGKIEFKNVWLAYKADHWVLKDISFIINPGETIALVGHTGSGKTSIINLLNRFYEFQKGEILIDGVDIRKYELGSLRQCIGVVVQDVFLFSGSIKDNITLMNSDIKPEKIAEAATVTGGISYINSLPGKFDFKVMERGSMLSSGQRQLIAFMRAYVYNPGILILDEATSSVDSESEKLITKATKTITRGRTSVIVAHRLGTIKNADRIIVLDQGEIKESGNHQELIEMKGAYYELHESQFKHTIV